MTKRELIEALENSAATDDAVVYLVVFPGTDTELTGVHCEKVNSDEYNLVTLNNRQPF